MHVEFIKFLEDLTDLIFTYRIGSSETKIFAYQMSLVLVCNLILCVIIGKKTLYAMCIIYALKYN
jgi:CHASE3 domain sensor protein